MFEESYRDALVPLNLTSNQKSPHDPVGGPESDATSEELHDRYRKKEVRVFGEMSAQISTLGSVERLAIGPEIRKELQQVLGG